MYGHILRNRRAVCGAYLAVILGLLGGLTGCATTPKEPPLTVEQRQLNLESFDYVWTKINDTHWDPELGGVDWAKARDELRPKVEQAAVMSESRAAMNELIGRLGKSHFAIFPAELYDDLQSPAGEGARDGGTGIDVRVLEGQALVTAVEEGSPAAAAGVHPGWEVLRVDDEDVTAIVRNLIDELEETPSKRYRVTGAVASRLSGPVGEPVAVTFRDGNDDMVTLDIVRAENKGRRIQFGHLPATYVWIDTRMLEGNIGYIAFNMFFDPTRVMGTFNKAMTSFLDADGVVIDIRGNPGGIGAMAMGMSGWLVAERDQRLGTMYMRDNELKYVVKPRPKTYDGPVVLLVDALSGSTSEILAGGLQGLGRVKVVGTTTAGASLPSHIEKLANGDGFQYATANYISEGGGVLEGVGVIPDIEVQPTRAALLEGRDPALETAVAWIRDQG